MKNLFLYNQMKNGLEDRKQWKTGIVKSNKQYIWYTVSVQLFLQSFLEGHSSAK